MKASRTRLAQVIAGDLDQPDLNRAVAAYLLSEGRVDELDSLMRDVMKVRVERGVVEVSVKSAHPFSDQVRNAIQTEVKRLYPTARQIIINEVIDQDVVGGARLQFADRQLDLSIRSKLNHLKQLKER